MALGCFVSRAEQARRLWARLALAPGRRCYRLQDQAMLLGLIEKLHNRGSWCGETHIQKCSYFLQDGLGVPLDLEFFLYKHGPFSFELRELLSEMRANAPIGIETRPPYGGKIAMTDQGCRLLAAFSSTVAAFEAQIEFVADRLAPKGVGVVQLERLGTAL